MADARRGDFTLGLADLCQSTRFSGFSCVSALCILFDICSTALHLALANGLSLRRDILEWVIGSHTKRLSVSIELRRVMHNCLACKRSKLLAQNLCGALMY